MLYIENDQLKIEVIDPQKDVDLLGSRYCTGGQIFQVYDKEKGPLFSGPTYPGASTTFNSQGIPDAFNAYPGFADKKIGDLVMGIGVGLIRYSTAIEHSFAKENTEVVEALDWKIQKAENALGFYAIHDYKEHAYSLTREIILDGRELVVVNVLENCGDAKLPLSWFAHPFFPHTKDGVVGAIPADLDIMEWYSLEEGNQLKVLNAQEMTPDRSDRTFINGTPHNGAGEDDNLIIPIKHDLLDVVEIECAFPVTKLPFWFNNATFSPEPYLIDELLPNENAQWEIIYRL